MHRSPSWGRGRGATVTSFWHWEHDRLFISPSLDCHPTNLMQRYLLALLYNLQFFQCYKNCAVSVAICSLNCPFFFLFFILSGDGISTEPKWSSYPGIWNSSGRFGSTASWKRWRDERVEKNKNKVTGCVTVCPSWKRTLKPSTFVIRVSFQSSPSLAILAPSWFISAFLML